MVGFFKGGQIFSCAGFFCRFLSRASQVPTYLESEFLLCQKCSLHIPVDSKKHNWKLSLEIVLTCCIGFVTVLNLYNIIDLALLVARLD